MRSFEELPVGVQQITEVVVGELLRAQANHPAMASAHEGWAVIFEEVDELWDEVKKRNPSRLLMMEEAVQVAAMAMRFVFDVIREKEDTKV